MKKDNDWAKLLVEARHTRVEKVPEGFEPIWVIAKKVKLSTSSARSELSKLIGKSVERKKFVIVAPSGKILNSYHYRQIK